MSTIEPRVTALLHEICGALGGNGDRTADIHVAGVGEAASVFAVTDLAAASIGAAGVAIAQLITLRHGVRPSVRVDRRLSFMWFALSLRPQGWTRPPPWDPIAGDYRA